jgi:hypothetical protein
MRKSLSVLVLVFGVSGCVAVAQQRNPSAADAESHEISNQRFLPISPSPQFIQGVPWHGFFALDTQTGQLCRTTIFEFTKGGTDFNSLPTCFSLSQEAASQSPPKNDPLRIR